MNYDNSYLVVESLLDVIERNVASWHLVRPNSLVCSLRPFVRQMQQHKSKLDTNMHLKIDENAIEILVFM